MAEIAKILVAGEWRAADAESTFRATNPSTKEASGPEFPVSSRADVDACLEAGSRAARELRSLPAAAMADFLEKFASRIEARGDELVEAAHTESALPKSPRLADVELPRTSGQLRQAAAAARSGDWTTPTVDTQTGIRARRGPLGAPVAVFGPNNFPFAFNSAAGGDFAAAIGAGNPVIAKANTSHPLTTQLFAEEAALAVSEAGLPAATVQLLYRTSHETGAYFVSHRQLGATGYTGSRGAGLVLKAAADAVGKPIYLELSSINPVIILPGAVRERADAIADDFGTSCLMGAGQFCTNPGIVVLLAAPETDSFIEKIVERFRAAPVGTLLGQRVEAGLGRAIENLRQAGAQLLVGGEPGGGTGFSYRNTVLGVTGADFVAASEAFQEEAFGNSTLIVTAVDSDELAAVVEGFEGNLTGCLYSHTDGEDDPLYDRVAPELRTRVGRLLNDKMPTGVAVSPAMNHGGPFPATGHPGFTAVGIPASLGRFSLLECYDNVRPGRLPPELEDKNPTGSLWRSIDGVWTQADVG